MDHLDFRELTEDERVATYGAFFAMAVADGALDDEELVNIFECLDLDGMSDVAVRLVRGFLIDPPDLATALAPLESSGNDVRYGVLVHLMDVALADTVYAPGERAAIQEAGTLLGANAEQIDAIEAFIRELRGIQKGGVGGAEADERLQTAAKRLDDSGVPRRSIALSGGVGAASAGGIGAATIGALGIGMLSGVGLALAGGTAAYFAMRLVTGANSEGGAGPTAAPGDVGRVIEHLQHAIQQTRERLTALESQSGGSTAESLKRSEQAKHLNNRIQGMQRLLARKRGEMR